MKGLTVTEPVEADEPADTEPDTTEQDVTPITAVTLANITSVLLPARIV